MVFIQINIKQSSSAPSDRFDSNMMETKSMALVANRASRMQSIARSLDECCHEDADERWLTKRSKQHQKILYGSKKQQTKDVL
jgi:hypothetical protein